MENPRTQTKVAMNYGMLYGLSGVAIFLLFYFLGTDIQSRLPQYAGYVLMIIFIILGIKSYRDEDLGGQIGYGKAVGTGILIAIFGGIISGVFSLIFFTYISPDMVEKLISAAQQNMADKGMTDEQIEMGMSMTRKFMSPMWLFLFSVLGAALMGLIFSLIISIFLKKEKNPFNSTIG
jgi:hypothetical protein